LGIGERTAEEIKMQMGSVWPLAREMRAEIRGRDLVTGLPRTVELSTRDIREAMQEQISAICDAVKSTLDKTPPELAADIMDCGITLAGGGALLRGICERLNDETGMPINLAPDPLYAVAIGSGQVLEEFEALRGVVLSSGEL
jgi:rod shape-determining protein MreB